MVNVTVEFRGLDRSEDVAHAADAKHGCHFFDRRLRHAETLEMAGIAELKAFRGMLSDSADLVRRQMKEGKTLDAIKGAGVPDKLAPWKKGFLKAPQWLELVYRSLEKGASR